MINTFRNTLTDIKNYLHKGDIEKNRLIDNIYTSVLLVENDYNNAVIDIKKKIRKESILNLLIDISTKLIEYKLGDPCLVMLFDDLMELLNIDRIYISKFKVDKFVKINTWSKTEFIDRDNTIVLTIDDAPHFFKHILNSNEYIVENNKFDETDQCFFDKLGIFGECVFPIIIDRKVWGVLGFIKYDRECKWNDDQIDICNILASIFSSHIKKYKLIDNLKQDSIMINTVVNVLRINTWSKDEFGKYVYCSPEWRDLFFGKGISVTNKTIDQLTKEYEELTGNRHEFADICKCSDDHCIDEGGDTCFYIEKGYIDNNVLVFGTIKTPIYSSGRLRGIVGIANDISGDVHIIDMIMPYYIEKGYVSILGFNNLYNKDVVVYWIKTEQAYNDILKGIMPR